MKCEHILGCWVFTLHNHSRMSSEYRKLHSSAGTAKLVWKDHLWKYLLWKDLFSSLKNSPLSLQFMQAEPPFLTLCPDKFDRIDFEGATYLMPHMPSLLFLFLSLHNRLYLWLIGFHLLHPHASACFICSFKSIW